MTATSGITSLRKIQLGRESSVGVAITPDINWRGTGSIEDLRKFVQVNENIGHHAPFDTTYITQTGGKITLEQEVNAEQILCVLDAGYALGSVGTDGAGSGKVWTAELPAEPAVTVPSATYTIRQIMTNGTTEWGDQGAYGFVQEYSISGKPGELLKLSSTWLTTGITTVAAAETIATTVAHFIPFGGGVMSIDNYNGTVGQSAKSLSLIGFDVNVKTGLMPAHTSDSLAFSIVKYTRPEVVAKITWEQNANAQTERQTHHWSQTPRLLRLKFVGAALTTPGTLYTYYTLIIDICGKWTKFDPVDTMDGDEIITGTFTGMYNETAAWFHKVIVVNETAALP